MTTHIRTYANTNTNTERRSGRQPDRQTHTHTHAQTDKQTDRRNYLPSGTVSRGSRRTTMESTFGGGTNSSGPTIMRGVTVASSCVFTERRL